MAKQRSFFDDAPAAGDAIMSVAVPGSAKALTREQKQFKRLITQIGDTRLQLSMWREVVPDMQRRHASAMQPLMLQWREVRLALIARLDSVMDGKALTKGERRKVADMLNLLLSGLLQESEDAALIRLYNKYSDMSFEEERAVAAELLQDLTGATFGVKLSAREMQGTPDEIAARISQKLGAKEAKREARQAAKSEKAAKENPRLAAREAADEAAREAAEQGASKTVREVFRKLASELHPDREPDPAERARKTALMQKVNQAYANGDLLALLELQLEIEQINPAELAGMAHERLVRFIAVLKEQLQRLRDELDDIATPYAMMLGAYAPSDVSVADVMGALESEAAEIRQTVKNLEQDLLDYQDIAQLKKNLKHYEISAPDLDDEFAQLDDLMSMMPPLSSGRGRRRR